MLWHYVDQTDFADATTVSSLEKIEFRKLVLANDRNESPDHDVNDRPNSDTSQTLVHMYSDSDARVDYPPGTLICNKYREATSEQMIKKHRKSENVPLDPSACSGWQVTFIGQSPHFPA